MRLACCLGVLVAVHALRPRPVDAAARPSRCSLVPIATARDSAATYLVGRARPDTVRAGLGRGPVSDQAGHGGRRAAGRAVYGQVLMVGRLGGAGRDTVERAFRTLERREIVVVPWDYDAGCEPVPWAGSARWVTTDAPGFYRLRLRPRAEWAGERPTFDAFAADLEPYPHGPFFARGYRGTSAVRMGPSLTPDEYLGLYAALPDHQTLRHATRARATAVAALDAWERANPEAARKYPASEILRWVRRSLSGS